ncbi:MAG: c-type cytochrome [Acidimicrobiia bacterium]
MAESRNDLDRALEVSTNRWMASGLVLLALFVAVFPIYRSYEPGRREDTRVKQQASLALQGAEIYDVNCASCHGVEGRGGIAPALATTQFLDAVDQDQIVQLISLGVPGSEMVAYSLDNGGPLTAEQVRAIAVFLRSLEEEAADNPSWRYPLAAEGLTAREIYLLGCSRCHGVNLEGTEDFPGLGAGSDAEEESDSRLARRIREGKDEMPSFGGTLGDEQIQLLVDYLREVQAAG